MISLCSSFQEHATENPVFHLDRRTLRKPKKKKETWLEMMKDIDEMGMKKLSEC